MPERLAIAPLRLDLIDEAEFWTHVDRSDPTPDECWYWLGPGIRWLGEPGLVSRAGHTMWAYRIAYAFVHGEPGPDRVVHHTCRQRGCCRPAHLVALTEAEHRTVHKGGVGTALVRMFGAELPPWSFLTILDTEMLERAECAPARSSEPPPRKRPQFPRKHAMWSGVPLEAS